MRIFALVALLVAIGLATAVSPFASASPDGLERVARDKGFESTVPAQPAPAPDYTIPGVADARLSTALAGLGGTVLVFGLGAGLLLVVRRRRTS